MAEEPDYTHLFPILVNIQQGCQYRWCGCGKSSTEPLCDKDNCEKSVTFVADITEEVNLCNCKQTKNPPFCDGSHGRLLMEAIKNRRT